MALKFALAFFVRNIIQSDLIIFRCLEKSSIIIAEFDASMVLQWLVTAFVLGDDWTVGDVNHSSSTV